MQLTPENKARIDALDYKSLLQDWRFSPPGDPWFQGETGSYWMIRMKELRNQPGGLEVHVRSSKSLGGER